MKFAHSKISRRLYITAAKPRISSTRSVVYHQPQAVYHQREALHRKRCSESQTKKFEHSELLPPVYGGRAGGRSIFANSKLYGYRQNLYLGAKLPVYARR